MSCLLIQFILPLVHPLMESDITLGIDLGTTHSLVSYVDPQTKELMSLSPPGLTTYPSTVHFSMNTTNPCVSFSDQAISGFALCPKRLIGQKFNESYNYDIKTYGSPVCGVEEGENENTPCSEIVPGYYIKSQKKKISATQVDAMILKQMKKDAEERLGLKVSRAVITVPVVFTWSQRIETERAAELAGFDSVELQLEPVMAAYEYCTANNLSDCTILIYDFGGGTFDICVVEYKDKVFSVLDCDGNSHLGGEDITMAICKELENRITGVLHHDLYEGLSDATIARIRLRIRCFAESKKVTIGESINRNIEVYLSNFYEDWEQHIDFNLNINTVQSIVFRTIEMTKNMARKYSQIDKVLIIGGSGDFCLVRARLRELFDDRVVSNISPLRCVSCGAARYGHSREVVRVNEGTIFTRSILPKGIGILNTKKEPCYIAKKKDELPRDISCRIKLSKEDNSLKTYLIEEKDNGFDVIKKLVISLGKTYPMGSEFVLRLFVRNDLLIYYEVRDSKNSILLPLTMVRI